MNTSIAAAARVTKRFMLVLLLTAIPAIAAPHEFQAGSARLISRLLRACQPAVMVHWEQSHADI
jgi:hypothetical protein